MPKARRPASRVSTECESAVMSRSSSSMTSQRPDQKAVAVPPHRVWHHLVMRKRRDLVKFRHSGAVVVAAAFGLFSAMPLALSSWYLAPVLLIPVAVGLWGARSGVDVNPTELVVRSTFGSRRLAWADVTGFTAVGTRVSADVAGGRTVPLPAVRPPDVPRLVSAGGQHMDESGDIRTDPVTLAG